MRDLDLYLKRIQKTYADACEAESMNLALTCLWTAGALRGACDDMSAEAEFARGCVSVAKQLVLDLSEHLQQRAFDEGYSQAQYEQPPNFRR